MSTTVQKSAPVTSSAPASVLCRNRGQSAIDGLPPGWVGPFDPNNPAIRGMIVGGKLEVVSEAGTDPNQVFLDLLATSSVDGPGGMTPDQMVRFTAAILSEFSGRLTFDPRARWSTGQGQEGAGFWGVSWGKRFTADNARARRFTEIRAHVSELAARYEEKNGRHTLGGGIFSRPE